MAGDLNAADGDGGRYAVPGHEVREPDAAAHLQDPDRPGHRDRQAHQAVHHHRSAYYIIQSARIRILKAGALDAEKVTFQLECRPLAQLPLLLS